jgi:hypothetical protein
LGKTAFSVKIDKMLKNAKKCSKMAIFGHFLPLFGVSENDLFFRKNTVRSHLFFDKIENSWDWKAKIGLEKKTRFSHTSSTGG